MTESIPESVAIIGLAGRFPGAANVDLFWRNLIDGVESISMFTDEELIAAGIDVAALKRERGYVAARGVLQDAEWFDAGFFGIIPKEAEVTDPQQRLFLETAWEALENAGCDPGRFPGLIGVYAGAGNSTYYLNNLHGHAGITDSMPVVLGNEKDFLATRVAYKLNLKGPAINVNTACSTSLVAVCQACQSLLNFQSDLALAGGVSVTFPQRRAYRFQEGGIVSPDGHCRAFDAQAQGTVSGDGVGIVVLKRLSEAVKDGDEIYAVIKGTGLNNDGSAKVSFTSPSVEGQAEVIALAQAQAGFDPATISYIEAHGTGTPLGDPIEIEGLTRAFGDTVAKNFCAIGSLKTNVGHLDSAAGVAGLIKTVLALKHGLIPPSLHFERPNPQIDFENTPFRVNTRLTGWKAGLTPRRAGVSSFGLGGTNAHVVLEEAPAHEPTGPARNWQLLVLSAKSESALDAATGNLVKRFKEKPDVGLADATFTLQTGRAAFNHRRMLVCRDGDDALKALEMKDPKRVVTRQHEIENPPVVFMFPGQGAQYAGMGAELYRTEPAFGVEVDRCADILRPHLDRDLRGILFPRTEESAAAAQLVGQTRFTQPALFVIEYALARLWMSWGVTPSAMIGHSVGEYVAGCLAGVFTLEEALKLVAERARLIQAQPGGAMLAVRASETDVQSLLGTRLSLAAVNSAASCVVSGPYEAIEDLEKLLEGKGVAARRLQTSHAFHSTMMEPVIGPFTELLRKVELKEPSIAYVSNVTAGWVTAAETTNPEYWAGHVRQTVRFASGVTELLKDPHNVLLEVGPGQTLSALARQHAAMTPTRTVLSSFFTAKEQPLETCAMLNALGKLWLAGVKADWTGFHANGKRHRVPLPTYPFERKRYWVEPPAKPVAQTAVNSVSQSARVAALDEPANSPNRAGATSAGEVLPRKTRIHSILARELEKLSGANLSTFSPSTTFAEMGFDSLFLAQASRSFERKFGVRVTFRQLMEEWPTLPDLAGYIDEQLQPAALATEKFSPSEARTTSAMDGSSMAITIPLTDAQMEVWSAAQLGADASRAFNQIVSVSLRGPIVVDALRGSLQELVDRHDALRSTFLPDGSGQKILPMRKLELPLIDLSSLPNDEQEKRLKEAIAAEDNAAFDLVTGPLLRTSLIKLSATHHVVLITTHHLVMDGWSLGVVLRELEQIYPARKEDRPHQLPPAAQYRDYVQWQSDAETHARFAEAEDYWLKQFATLPAAVDLPSDRPRPAVKTYRAQTASLRLNPELYRSVKDAAAREGCTLFAYLFASFTTWLKRLGGQDDLVVGVPAAGQIAANHGRDPEGESLVGHCANLLPIRCRCEGESTFKEHLKTIKRVTMDAQEHQLFTFGKLVKRLNPPRDPSRVPLISTTFNLVRANAGFNWPGVQSKVTFPSRTFNIFDVTVDLLDSGEVLHIECRFNADLFDVSTMRRWLGHWRTLMEGATADPTQAASALPLLTETERRQLVTEWNQTQSDFPRGQCLQHFFEAQVARSSNSVAAAFENRRLTYDELNREADELAIRLKKEGVGPDVLVGLYMERSLDMLVGLLGILKAGGAYVPLDPNFPRERLEFILRDAQPAVLLTQGALSNDLGAIAFPAKNGSPIGAAKIICVDEKLAGSASTKSANGSNIRSSTGIDHNNLAYVLYTSGSTGRPKGVQISHRALVNFLTSMQREPGLDASDILLAVTTLSFDIAGLELWLPLITGAEVVIASSEESKDGNRLAKLFTESAATIMQATPATWRMLLAAGWKGSSKLKILCGGEAWPEELVRELLPRCGSLWNMYGPTETTIWSAVEKIEAPRLPVIGLPIANTQFHVLDAGLQASPVGVPGELHIGGDGLARGYLNRPELTAEKFISDPFSKERGARMYKTGDLTRRRADGKIEFLGRMDQQVKIRGHRIELEEIEAALRLHPALSDLAAAARDDGRGEKALVAYIVARDGAPSAKEMRSFLKDKLPEYMIPTGFVSLKSLPLTPNGKVDRKALPAPDAEPAAEDEFAAPETPAQIAMAKIWCEILGRPRVSLHDNFFDLGGHSLMATQLISRLGTFHGVERRLRDIFDSPNLAEMSEWLEK